MQRHFRAPACRDLVVREVLDLDKRVDHPSGWRDGEIIDALSCQACSVAHSTRVDETHV